MDITKISVTRRVVETIEIPNREFDEAMMRRLEELLGGDHVADDGGALWLMRWVDCHHGSMDLERVRPATEDDLAMLRVIEWLAKKRIEG